MAQGVGCGSHLGNDRFPLYRITMPDHLSSRAVIALTGSEAQTFLQSLVTNNVTKVSPSTPVYAALLSAQGKILFDFLVSDAGDGLFIDCAVEARVALIKRLSLYKLRAKVEITPRDDLSVVFDGPNDPRHNALPPRSIRAASGANADAAYLTTRLDLGIPEGADFGSEKMFALDAGLDELHGVAFNKGCFVGQELTARMKHRGTDRKRLLLVASDDGTPLWPAPVTSGDIELGQITATYGARGFALIRLDRLSEAKSPLSSGGTPVTLTKQEWLCA